MKKIFSLILAVMIIISNTAVSLAASDYSVRIDKTVYSPGTYMSIEITAASKEWFSVEILKGENTLASLPASGNNVALKVLIPANWKNGTDYVLRAGRGSDIASVGFEISYDTGGAIYALSVDKTTVKVGDKLILSGTSNVANAAVQYSINASGGGFAPKTGEVIIENNQFECFVDIGPAYVAGTYAVKVGGNNVFSNECVFSVINTPKVGAISALPQSSKVSAGATITLSTSTQNAVIYYTLDGQTPTKSSALYTSGGITINSTATLRAIAMRDGYENSDIFTQTYTVDTIIIGGVGGGAGGGGAASDTIPAAGGAVSVSYNKSGGAVTLTLPEGKVKEIIKNAVAGTAGFDLSGVSGAADAVFPAAALEQIAGAELDVKIVLPKGTVTLTADAAASASSKAGGENVAISLNAVSRSDLTAVQREAIGAGDLVFEIKIMHGAQAAHDLGGKVIVTVPYSGALPVAVWYLSDTAELEKLDCVYDGAAKTVTFTTTHLSLYAVGQDTDAPVINPFADVAGGTWYFGDVMYVYGKALMGGTAENRFSPDDTLTRAMIVTTLWRNEGSPEAEGSNAGFADVAQGSYYKTAVDWAAASSIVHGYGGGLFGPDDPITRQDLAVILTRYMDYKKIELPVTQQWIVFADEAAISDYARNAIQILNKLGIINGVGNNTIDPKGNATRGQAAAMLHRFITAIQ